LSGDTAYAHRIVQYLGADQPVFGVQSSDPIRERKLSTSLEEMAARNAEYLSSLYPEGSYRMVGYSFAGFLAYETARQLSARGREVKLLAVIDTGPWRRKNFTLASVLGTSIAILRNLPAWVSDNLLRTQSRGFFGSLRQHFRTLSTRGGRILSSGRWASWKPELEDFFDVSRLPEDYRQMMEMNLRAFREYVPKPFPGKVTLLRARTRPLFQSSPEDMGWGKWASGGVDVKLVPGHHESILEEPSARVLAEHLRTAMEHAQ
jgi:thioesterase domain-containing protein